MCQQPTQEFFTTQLGLPLRMTPDFETKSCQMTFGLAPLPLSEDPAFTGGCLEGCKMSGQFKPDATAEDAACYVQNPGAEGTQAT
jgi:Beta-carotene isomerase D27-like, C-terminal